MKLGELINYLEDFREKAGEDAIVATDLIVDDKITTRSEVANIKVYADTTSEGDWVKPIVAIETKVNVLGSVDTSLLVNAKLNDLIKAAKDSEESDGEAVDKA